MEEKKILYTKEGYQALLDELDDLKNNKVPDNKKRLAEARSFGDLSENSEYDEARDEQAKIYARIAELEENLRHAELHDDSETQEGKIGLGSVVKVHDCTFDEDLEYRIVGSNEANPLEGKISDLSPIGIAILGHVAGDEVTFETPGGEAKLQILDVQKANRG